jgi:copper chaperone CopZ
MTTIEIQNLKCHGCANTITKAITKIKGISDFSIDVPESKISFNTEDATLIDKVKTKLAKLGYPEADASNSTIQKAKSYVSCAIGRIND